MFGSKVSRENKSLFPIRQALNFKMAVQHYMFYILKHLKSFFLVGVERVDKIKIPRYKTEETMTVSIYM